MKLKAQVLLSILWFFTMSMQATDIFVNHQQGDWLLNANGRISIYVSDSDQRGVMHAARHLQTDLQTVCDAQVSFTDNPAEANIIVGTVGSVAAVKAYQPQLRGKYEMYIIDARQDQLVIAGSDRRGTIFGIYELSRQAGVSPWYYWADVPITRHQQLYIRNGQYTDGEPAVRWRGLFLNDEAPCLTSWVKNTFGTDYGGHDFYEKVFELILRLKGNMLWPAMWGWAFYADDSLNSPTADEMGVIIGTSHHEPMARNHQEYARKRNEWGPWNYQTNQTNLDRFFREGIERMKGTDDVVTIGMRGDGDEAMSQNTDTGLLERIINSQRRIISQVTGRPAKQTPQVWALYKEVQDYYDAGLKVPDDVCILISDDNWGDIRRVPNAQERLRKGGWGIYYHVDYVGAPRNTKWLNVTQTQQMTEQLRLAYDFGIEQLWILNVGDLKPMEYPIQLYFDMAWNPTQFNVPTVTDHTRSFFSSVLAGQPEMVITEAADIYNRNCQYMARVTPEMLDASTYQVSTGEWRRVADDYQRLEARALRLNMQLPAECHDAYNELVLFPVQAMANLYDMYYAQAMNHYLAERSNPEANDWARRVSECFRRDSLLCADYNNLIAGGKWRGMMTQKHIGYRSWNDNFPRDILPRTQQVETQAEGGCTFGQGNGYIAMEAAHYYQATAPEGTQWTIYPYYGRTHSAVALTPYTQLSTADAKLTYRFALPQGTQKVKVHVIVKSTLDFLNVGGHEYTVSLDGAEPVVINFNSTLLDRQPYMYSEFYPTIARRVVEKEAELTVGNPTGTSGLHELTLHPRHPGIVFEKIVVDYGGYTPQYLFGEETDLRFGQ